MAYTVSNLSRIGHANGQSKYLYSTTETIATVLASGYFNTSYKEFFKGDRIIVNTSTGGTMVPNVLVITSTSGATTVTTRRLVQPIIVPFQINQTDLLAPTVQDYVAPCAGTITDFQVNPQITITTGGTLVVKIVTTATTGGIVTLANAAAKGTVVAATAFTALNVVAKGDRVTITPASFATAGAVNGWLEFTPT